jgi:hypothetical protein
MVCPFCALIFHLQSRFGEYFDGYEGLVISRLVKTVIFSPHLISLRLEISFCLIPFIFELFEVEVELFFTLSDMFSEVDSCRTISEDFEDFLGSVMTRSRVSFL